MKSADAVNLQGLLRVARGNIKGAREELKTVAWPKDMVGIGRSISRGLLALEQTINAVDRILEDLK